MAKPALPIEWTETQLLTRVLSRDGQAWAELVRRYRPLIFRCIGKVTGRSGGRSGADLDEIYAEVLLQLVRDDMHKLRIYDPARGTKLSSWIGMLSINAAYDHLRAAGRRPTLVAEVPEQASDAEGSRSPLAEVLEKERWSHFRALLTDFTDKDRTFVDLYFQRGLEPEAVAAEMQISLKTVYSKKHKIRSRLEHALSPLANEAA